jgi:predicted dehydrogenase
MVDSPEAMIGEIDLAIVVDRHGDLHADHALPFIAQGLPVFIDKPLAIAHADCERILAAADASGSAISSFSALRFAPGVELVAEQLPSLGAIRTAHFAGPCDFASPYGGPFFYATHVIEMALRLVGEDVRTLRATRHNDQVVVVVTWDRGTIGTFSLMTGAAYHFFATLFGASAMIAQDAFGGALGYRNVLEQILQMAETGVRPLTNEQLLRPISMVHAIVASLESGGAEIALT